MTLPEAYNLPVGTYLVTHWPPRSIVRFVRAIKSQYSIQVECCHQSSGYAKGDLLIQYVYGVETLEEASICSGRHQETKEDGSCIVCGFSREAQEWEKSHVQ